MTAQGGSSALLQAGITQNALSRVVNQYRNDELTASFQSYIKTSVDSVIPFIGNATFDTSYPLDRLSNGDSIITQYLATGNATYYSSALALQQSIDLQPRNGAGGLWYYVYPNWSYLDGMYSYAPFSALLRTKLHDGSIENSIDDIALQLNLLWDHCHDNATNLLVHGYDFSKTAIWANPITGGSPHVWGRSLGWYMISLVDTLEILSPYNHLPQWARIKAHFERLALALVRAVDPVSGAWWQILDQPGRDGNYIESSGSSMFVYALLKGERLGWLQSVQGPAVKAYEYIAETFVDKFANRTLGWNGTVSVCSLNSTASYDVCILSDFQLTKTTDNFLLVLYRPAYSLQ